MRTESRLLHRLATASRAGFAVALLGAALVALPASPASATTASSNCTPAAYGPMCYYYKSYYGGARAAINGWVNDLYAYEFSNTGTGAYQDVANNAGSGVNADTRCVARIWEHVAQTGRVKDLNYNGYIGDRDSTLDELNNNNRSQSWRDCF
ncbi:hypothetical protein GA0070624_0654 [Micromonospora rhizosphaerae]|uniref:Peptidase inhibitor family I36 n=1 Tax=Micromonospora rhizosphaerae TaxID=568872 RepID=A0A1C6RDJ5_9ACTN|nr:hypothetical protein [Micromonospora rhizosphaerae]SCL15218.1 hypothetical protein GA0070624_0654 [Micromonospora rhizosphaerae]